MKSSLINIQNVVLSILISVVLCFQTFAQNSLVENKAVPAAAKDGLFYMWLFDEGVAGHQFSTIYDTSNYWIQKSKTNFFQDTFEGNFKYEPGVSGTCGRFDGLTTRIIRTYIKVPDLTDGFTFEGWIAPYTTSGSAIVSQEKDTTAGFIYGLFGGNLGIQMKLGDKWIEYRSDATIPSLEWSHAAITFHKDKGIKLYLNGKSIGSIAVKGTMTDARRENLLIGMSSPKEIKLRESGGKFPPIEKKLYHHMAYDGLIDELKLYEEALSAADIKELYNTYNHPKNAPLKRRMRPVAPKVENPRFGATYCRLNYYPEYESVRRIGDYPDLVVRFDDSQVRLMFAHHIQYIPIWVTENDKMMSDQSLEINAKNGYYEVMMDKQNRYTHVRLLENSEARVVIHWRYALCDRFYQIARPNALTGYGDWADEYFTIYPDGVTVRHQIYYTSTYGEDYLQFQETILHNQPGERSDANVELNALTLANMEGQTHTYSWAKGVPPYYPQPPGANIQLVNMNSKNKPYVIFEPGSQIDKYIWGYRKNRGYQVPGILASGFPIVSKGKELDSYQAVTIFGMTEKPVADLVTLAKSWVSPPTLTIKSASNTSFTYDKFQKAYVFESGMPGSQELQFDLLASEQSPLINPAFIIKNWGQKEAEVMVNGNKLQRGSDFRLAHKSTLSGSDLIIWLKYQSTDLANIALKPL
jgi:hypothetical protein